MSAAEYYSPSGAPATSSQGSSAVMRAEFDLVQTAFGKLPGLSGNGSLAVFINSAGTAMEAVSAATARSQLGLAIGTDVQAHDADLDAIAALANTDGNFIVGNGSAWVAESGATARTSLGLGSIATQDASAVAITGGTISGITDLAIADGGTGSSTASAARTALGLAIGSDVQAYDAELAAIAGLVSAADKLPYFTGVGTAAVTSFSAFARTLVDDADAATARTTLGVAIGTDVQAYDADLGAVAGLATTGLVARTGAGTAAARTVTAGTGIGVTNGDGVSGNPTVAITDAELLAIAGLTSAADSLPYFTGLGTAALATLTTAGRALIDDASASAQRTTLGVAIGSDVQAYDAGLLSIAGLTTAADKMIYTTALDTYAVTALTSFARTVLDDTTAAAARTTLGAAASGLATASGLTQSTNKLLGRGTAGTGAVEEIGVGSGLQISAGNLEVTLAGGSVTSIDVSGGTTGLTTSGGPVTTSGTITIAGTLAIGSGGTGAGSASAARTALGLAIGTNVQAYDAELAALAGLTSAADKLPYFTGAGTAGVTAFTAFGRTLVDDADAATARTTLGLGTLATQSGTFSGTSSGTNSGDQTITLTGDVTGSGTGSFAATIGANKVTLGKMATMATASFLGRNTALTGDPEVLSTATAKTMLGLSGSNTGDQTITLTGDVTGSGTGSFAATIGAGKVTLAKMANIATQNFIGRDSAGTSTPEALSVATVRSMLSISNVEDTALSTWAGSTNLITAGTITTGTWSGSTIALNKGGTGSTTATAALTALGFSAFAKTLIDDTDGATALATLGGTAATGTGAVVRATSPSLTTPALGTPASGNLANCTGYPGAALVLISSATASSSASVDFTSGIDSTYDEYIVEINGYVPATDNTGFWLQVSQDGGSTWKSGATDYRETAFSNVDGGTISTNGGTGTHIDIALNVGNVGNRVTRSTVRISKPSDTTKYKLIMADTVEMPSSTNVNRYTVGGIFQLNTSAINAIRFLSSSGNITSGTFSLYGIKKT